MPDPFPIPRIPLPCSAGRCLVVRFGLLLTLGLWMQSLGLMGSVVLEETFQNGDPSAENPGEPIWQHPNSSQPVAFHDESHPTELNRRFALNLLPGSDQALLALLEPPLHFEAIPGGKITLKVVLEWAVPPPAEALLKVGWYQQAPSGRESRAWWFELQCLGGNGRWIKESGTRGAMGEGADHFQLGGALLHSHPPVSPAPLELELVWERQEEQDQFLARVNGESVHLAFDTLGSDHWEDPVGLPDQIHGIFLSGSWPGSEAVRIRHLSMNQDPAPWMARYGTLLIQGAAGSLVFLVIAGFLTWMWRLKKSSKTDSCVTQETVVSPSVHPPRRLVCPQPECGQRMSIPHDWPQDSVDCPRCGCAVPVSPHGSLSIH